MSEHRWENSVYGAGMQINHWPYTSVVSYVMRRFANCDRSAIRVLELGCGTGNNLRFLAEEGFHAEGIDQSATAVRTAEELLDKHGLKAELYVGSIRELPFPDETFDLVFDRAAVVHNCVSDIEMILEESRRVLKSGGAFLSIGLKGADHPQKALGIELEACTWGNFSAGKFKDVGIGCFIKADDLDMLFRRFSSTSWRRHKVFSAVGKLLDEEYEVEAVK